MCSCFFSESARGVWERFGTCRAASEINKLNESRGIDRLYEFRMGFRRRCEPVHFLYWFVNTFFKYVAYVAYDDVNMYD